MFPSSNNPLTFTKVLSGISKSLSIANQIIPIYEQTKPLISNAKSVMSVIKKVKLPTPASTQKINQNTNRNTKKVITYDNNFNNPTFFQ